MPLRVSRRPIRLSAAPDSYHRYFGSAVVNAINDLGTRLEAPISGGWSTGTYTATRAVANAATITLQQLADVVSTFVQDAKDAGKLAGGT